MGPWTTEVRYPADLPDVDHVVLDKTVAAAKRLLAAASSEIR